MRQERQARSHDACTHSPMDASAESSAKCDYASRRKGHCRGSICVCAMCLVTTRSWARFHARGNKNDTSIFSSTVSHASLSIFDPSFRLSPPSTLCHLGPASHHIITGDGTSTKPRPTRVYRLVREPWSIVPKFTRTAFTDSVISASTGVDAENPANLYTMCTGE